jgi:hypothetical protein
LEEGLEGAEYDKRLAMYRALKEKLLNDISHASKAE